MMNIEFLSFLLIALLIRNFFQTMAPIEVPPIEVPPMIKNYPALEQIFANELSFLARHALSRTCRYFVPLGGRENMREKDMKVYWKGRLSVFFSSPQEAYNIHWLYDQLKKAIKLLGTFRQEKNYEVHSSIFVKLFLKNYIFCNLKLDFSMLGFKDKNTLTCEDYHRKADDTKDGVPQGGKKLYELFILLQSIHSSSVQSDNIKKQEFVFLAKVGKSSFVFIVNSSKNLERTIQMYCNKLQQDGIKNYVALWNGHADYPGGLEYWSGETVNLAPLKNVGDIRYLSIFFGDNNTGFIIENLPHCIETICTSNTIESDQFIKTEEKNLFTSNYKIYKKVQLKK